MPLNLGFKQWPTALGSASQVTPAIDRLIDPVMSRQEEPTAVRGGA